MNERMRELVEQARYEASLADCQETFDEKFAELIVRECATLAFDGPNGILEHFGVKHE